MSRRLKNGGKNNEIINQKDMLYQELQNRKAALNVKMIGEGVRGLVS